MEDRQREKEWLRVRQLVKKAMDKNQLPDLETILFLIGVQELGIVPKKNFTKEEKTDFMHLAVCTLLEKDGYYVFIRKDEDGWPHWYQIRPFDTKDKAQENFLIEKIIDYFEAYKDLQDEN